MPCVGSLNASGFGVSDAGRSQSTLELAGGLRVEAIASQVRPYVLPRAGTKPARGTAIRSKGSRRPASWARERRGPTDFGCPVG